MEKYIYNEQNGLWYELQGDYYIPCLVLDKEDTQPIGMWDSHLAEVANRAAERFERLMKQLAEKEGITEKLKAQDQMVWAQRMNNIRNTAEALVNAELIFAKQKWEPVNQDWFPLFHIPYSALYGMPGHRHPDISHYGILLDSQLLYIRIDKYPTHQYQMQTHPPP